MADDLDHYTNTYLIYSKDPVNSQKFLSSSEVINWKQHLQIQSKRAGEWGGGAFVTSCEHMVEVTVPFEQVLYIPHKFLQATDT